MDLAENGAVVTEVVICVFLTTSIITMFLRGYVRKCIVQSFGLDDWFIVAATIGFVTWMGVCLAALSFGVGRHRQNLTDHDAELAFLMYWISYFTYGVVITLARISVGLFFLRVTVNDTHRLIVWLNIGLNCLAGVVFFGIVVFQCAPVSFFWKKVYEDAQGSCISYTIFVRLGYAYSAVCAFCDFVFVFLPILLVWKLDMSWCKKLGLIPILGMAGFAGCCPLVRIRYLPALKSDDFLYDTIGVAVWSIIEAGLAITASNLATLRPLFRNMSKHVSGSTRRSTRSYSKRSRHTLPVEYDRRIELTPKRLQSIINDDNQSEEVLFTNMSPSTLVDHNRDDSINVIKGTHWRDSKEELPKVHVRSGSDGDASPVNDLDGESQWPSWVGKRSIGQAV